MSQAEATGKTGSSTKNVNAAENLHEMEKLKRGFEPLVRLLIKSSEDYSKSERFMAIALKIL